MSNHLPFYSSARTFRFDAFGSYYSLLGASLFVAKIISCFFSFLESVRMESGRAAGEHIPECEFLPVSPSDSLYYHVPPSVPGAEPVQPTARRRRVSAAGNVRSKPPARDLSAKTRFHWHGAATIALIEAKKEEQDEEDAKAGRSNILTADQNWKLIKEKLAKKNISISRTLQAIESDNGYESAKHNSGKGENDVSKSANAIRHFKWLVESEEKKEATKCARSKEVVEVLGVMDRAFFDIAQIFKERAQADDL
ncbi:hypothetical protein R1sor_011189 [Riccia sorocarpa]|uniref:No apical meristem-associated C-terminal domain-containing protein n=1 Tax=Riccia sorocarpa TaxID=122646 RepID=A0ABD3I068_9MARC